MGRAQRRRKKIQKCKISSDNSKILKLQKALRLKCPNIKVNYFNDTGWGIKCKKKIEKGEILIALPFRYLITAEVSCDIFDILKFENKTPQFVLSIFLIYESHLKEKSKYYEYIESLPEYFTNPYFCSNEEVKLLPEFIRKEVISQTLFINGYFENLLKIIVNKFCPHCQIALEKIFSRDKFVWAWFVVNTRSVYYEDQKSNKSLALAPFLDLFNHSNDALTKISIDFENELYILKTYSSFKKFEQVFIKYGNHSNLKLFIEYGFFVPNNPNDFVEFSFDEVVEGVRIIDLNCGELTRLKYKFIESNKLNQNLTKSTEFSWNLNGLIYVLITKDHNLSVLQSKTYSNSFTLNESITIQKVGDTISQKKLTQLKQSLLKMEELKNCTPSFQIAKSLIQNYIKLLL